MKHLLLTILFVTQLWSITSAAQFKMSGLDYTARTQPSGCPSQADVTAEIANIYSVANSVRIYSLVDCNQGALILQAIKDLNINLRVALGIWLDTYFYIEFPNEYAQLINLANTYGLGQVDYVIVGSETQYRADFSSDILISYIRNISTTVKTQLGYPNIKVTTADVVQNLIGLPQVVAVVDVVAYNQFSFWEGVPIEGAIANNQNWYNQMVQNAQGKPVIISEVGWLYQAAEHPTATAANVNTYLQNFVCWASPAGITYFYFSAYDALWQPKDEQKYWGIFNEQDQLKAGLSLNFPCSAPIGVSTSAPITSAPTTQMITTQTPTTVVATTQTPTTVATTQAQTTVVATTQAPTNPATTQPATNPATTQAPTNAPTSVPTTSAPTNAPTSAPTTSASTTVAPTSAPSTTTPTNAPTSSPTNPVTTTPTRAATSTPTRTTQPTTTPSGTTRPSVSPTTPVTSQPTQAATTMMPTNRPTTSVTSQPTQVATTMMPTNRPTTSITSQPTQVATTAAPVTTSQPTSSPTNQPTQVVTSQPTAQPTSTVTQAPTSQPTSQPTSTPTSQPTQRPTSTPSSSNTAAPTSQATTQTPIVTATATRTAAPTVTSAPTSTVTTAPGQSDASRIAVSFGLAVMIAVVTL